MASANGRFIAVSAGLSSAVALAAAWCFSPSTGSVVNLPPKCSHPAPGEWVYTQYSPSSYVNGCGSFPTPGCNECRTRPLDIEYNQSVWGGSQCTTPLQSSGGWTVWSTVSEGYYVRC